MGAEEGQWGHAVFRAYARGAEAAAFALNIKLAWDRGSSAGRRALIGGAAGGLLGFAAGGLYEKYRASDNKERKPWRRALMGGLAGGALGALGGAVTAPTQQAPVPSWPDAPVEAGRATQAGLSTRTPNRDYDFRGGTGLAARRRTYPESAPLVVEGDGTGWRIIAQAVPSSRTDSAGRPIMFHPVMEGAVGDENSAAARFTQARLRDVLAPEGNVTGTVFDKVFTPDLTEHLYGPSSDGVAAADLDARVSQLVQQAAGLLPDDPLTSADPHQAKLLEHVRDIIAGRRKGVAAVMPLTTPEAVRKLGARVGPVTAYRPADSRFGMASDYFSHAYDD